VRLQLRDRRAARVVVRESLVQAPAEFRDVEHQVAASGSPSSTASSRYSVGILGVSQNSTPLAHPRGSTPARDQIRWGARLHARHAAGAEWPQRRHRELGRDLQHLLLARPGRRVTGLIMTQILPFADVRAVKLYGQFERGVYDSLKA
jgi:hypothetical protein